MCFEATGTEQHRFECRSTTPEEGWPLPPDKAMPAVRSLSALRLRILQTRGLLVLRIPVQSLKPDGSFLWLLEPQFQHPDIDDAVWYFDGSMLNGRWVPLRATGFGIAIVAKGGKLLACGRGSPPHWCATAAAAEAWALQFVLSLQPFPPKMRTDCQSLLTTLRDTPQHATAANKQLARIWVAVADILGGCFRSINDAGQLVWMPAHTTTSSVGEVKLSNGSRLSMVDWRANRLVDALAKMAALEAQYLPTAVKTLKSAEIAVRYAAKLLGRVTYAANHHCITIIDDKGISKTKTCRDAMEAPKRPKRRLSPVGAKPVLETTCQGIRHIEPALLKPMKAHSSAEVPLTHARAARKLAQVQLMRRADEIGSQLVAPPNRQTATDRLAALRRRVGLLPAASNE